MSEYVTAITQSNHELFLYAGTEEVAGFNSNTSALNGGGSHHSLVLLQQIHSSKNQNHFDNDHEQYLTLVIPKYLSVETSIINAFNSKDGIKKLTVNKTYLYGKAKKIIGEYIFEDGEIIDYTVDQSTIMINFVFAKLIMNDKLTQTTGISDSRVGV